MGTEVMKALGRLKQSEGSVERRKTQFRIQPREQLRDKRNPESIEVTDIKRMPKKEKGHG